MTDLPALIDSLPVQACQVFRAADLTVTSGVNRGDFLTGIDDVCMGDVYHLSPTARPLRLALCQSPAQGCQIVAEGSEIGQPGDAMSPLARYTLMTTDGIIVELSLMRQVRAQSSSPGTLLVLASAPLSSRHDYVLVKTEVLPASARPAQPMGLSFAHGTPISLPSGAQSAVDTLRAGDRILTRDRGPQPIRWIGRATLRATGAAAPVVIARGAMGNTADLVISRHHRLFMYRRDRFPGQRAAEMLVQAEHLVDGGGIRLREGGFVEYLCLVLDHHEIIYAGGLPTESLLVDDAALQRLPQDLAADLQAKCPGLRHRLHFAAEAYRSGLDRIGRDSLLRPLAGG